MPESYTTGGEATLELVRDTVVTLLGELRDTMLTAGDYNPALSFVYERHNVADLRLNAASVSISEADSVPPGFSRPNTQAIVSWKIHASIRVHTAYDDGIKDDQKSARLIDSINNKLWRNKGAFGDGLYLDQVTGIRNGVTFEESRTIGGELIAVFSRNKEYTLEA